MTLNSDAKFEETLTCGFKNDMRNWVNFNQRTQKSEKLYNDGFFLPKAYNFRGKNLGDICFITLNRHAKFKGKLSCDLINDLRNLINFHFEEKLTLDSKNEIRNLVNFNACNGKPENLHFDIKFQLKKSREMLSLMTLKKDPNFKEKLTFCLKNNMRNLVDFNASCGKSV